jgi:hypothetical protein
VAGLALVLGFLWGRHILASPEQADPASDVSSVAETVVMPEARVSESRVVSPPMLNGYHLAGSPMGEAEPHAKALPNELVVIVRPGGSIDQLATELGAKVAGRIESLGAYRLQFADANAAAGACQLLETSSQVDAIDSNYLITPVPTAAVAVDGSAALLDLKVTPGDANGQLIVGLIDSAIQPQGMGIDDAFLLSAISVAGESAADSTTPTHGSSMVEAILQGLALAQDKDGSTSVKILPVDVYGASATTTKLEPQSLT